MDVDEEEDSAPGEHERMYLEAETIMTFLGGLVEGWFRTGDLGTPVRVGWGADRADIIGIGERLCADYLGLGPFADRGYGHAWMGSMRSAAIALTERHPHFWLAVGLVAGALMREKTLDGSEVEKLVREAASQG